MLMQSAGAQSPTGQAASCPESKPPKCPLCSSAGLQLASQIIKEKMHGRLGTAA